MVKEEVKVGEILAHRCWWVPTFLAPANTLRSFAANWLKDIDTTWLPGKVLTAVIVSNFTGIHSLKRRDDAIRFREFIFKDFNQYTEIAIGSVHIWGIL